jgi:chemotaxis protein CheD
MVGIVNPGQYEKNSATLQSDGSDGFQTIVEMADAQTSDKPIGKLTTKLLGAGSVVAIYDPEVHVGGLLHYLLPESRINPRRALTNPYLFADTGIPMLFRRVYQLGAVKERIVTKLVGGRNVLDPENVFDLGCRNQRIATEILMRNGVAIVGKHLGGLEGITVQLLMNTGSVIVALSTGEEFDL